MDKKILYPFLGSDTLTMSRESLNAINANILRKKNDGTYEFKSFLNNYTLTNDLDAGLFFLEKDVIFSGEVKTPTINLKKIFFKEVEAGNSSTIELAEYKVERDVIFRDDFSRSLIKSDRLQGSLSTFDKCESVVISIEDNISTTGYRTELLDFSNTKIDVIDGKKKIVYNSVNESVFPTSNTTSITVDNTTVNYIDGQYRINSKELIEGIPGKSDFLIFGSREKVFEFVETSETLDGIEFKYADSKIYITANEFIEEAN